MPGRKKIKIRVYNNEGKFIEEFETQSNCLKKYFPNDIYKRPLLIHKIKIFSLYHNKELSLNYGTINNELYFFNEPVYRDDIVHIHRVCTSEYCTKRKEKVVEVYNLQNIKIAEFISEKMLTLLMPHIPKITIYNQLRNESGFIKRHKGGKEELFFKYKD